MQPILAPADFSQILKPQFGSESYTPVCKNNTLTKELVLLICFHPSVRARKLV